MEMRSYRPADFTEEPHHDPEYMHTGLIMEIPALEKTYIHVSDDYGGVLGNFKLEKKVKELCKLLPQIQSKEIEGPTLKEAKEVTIEYSKRINIALAVKSGVIAKCRIRQGELFEILKNLVKNSGQLWEIWFREKFRDIIGIRFAQQCMQLARIPNIIRYSVFGMPRLLEIIRAFDPDDSDDPIGDFLQRHRILFDPETEPEIEGDKIRIDAVKVEIDFLIAKKKLEKNGLNNIDEGLLKTLVATVKDFKCNKKLIGDLQGILENGGDPNEYLRTLSLTGGLEPHTYNKGLQPHLDRIGAEWLDIAEECLNESERLNTIDYRIINKICEIASKIREMKTPLGK